MELTTKQVAAALGLSQRAVQNYIKGGKLPATEKQHGFQRQYFVSERDLRRFAKENGLALELPAAD